MELMKNISLVVVALVVVISQYKGVDILNLFEFWKSKKRSCCNITNA